MIFQDGTLLEFLKNILRGLVGKGLMVRYGGKRGLKEELLTVVQQGRGASLRLSLQ